MHTFTVTNHALLVIGLGMEDAEERLHLASMERTCSCFYDWDLNEEHYCGQCLALYRFLDDMPLVLSQVEQVCGVELDYVWVVEHDGDQPF